MYEDSTNVFTSLKSISCLWCKDFQSASWVSAGNLPPKDDTETVWNVYMNLFMKRYCQIGWWNAHMRSKILSSVDQRNWLVLVVIRRESRTGFQRRCFLSDMRFGWGNTVITEKSWKQNIYLQLIFLLSDQFWPLFLNHDQSFYIARSIVTISFHVRILVKGAFRI